ncbi:MAG: hypothetical protein GY811_06090 [Myxococcales bacterium]|nr:hypothetical protein [Myxococcales bacterium]
MENKNTQLGLFNPNIEGAEVDELGLSIPEDTQVNEESLAWMIQRAAKLQKCAKFIIGDALNFAVANYEGDVWGRYAEATGLDVATLKMATRVARQVPKECRNENLSFDHHKAVSHLDASLQEKYLTMADEKGLNRAKLRKSILLGREATDEDMAEKPGGGHDNLAPHVNRIVTLGRKFEESSYLEQADVEQLYAMHKDLLPVLELHVKLVRKMGEKDMTITDEIEEDLNKLNG